jgi:Cu+-exporting ATPase
VKGETTMAIQTDPVCGMKVEDQKATAQSTHEGKTYYFCCSGCKGKFDANPQQYASSKG